MSIRADRARAPWRWACRVPALRLRLFLGMLVVALCATAGFALAVNEFVEVLEQEMLSQTMSRELDGLVIDHHKGVDIRGPRGQSGAVFVRRQGASRSQLPAPLRGLNTSQRHLKIRMDEHEYYAALRQIPGASIYLIVDVDPIEALEKRLAVIGWATLATTILIAALMSLAFSYLILRPVRKFAQRVSDIEPQQEQRPIADDYHDRDMREIAASFDALIGRFRLLIDRERAFTADAGHELRTPLSVALTTHELLLAGDDLPARVRERLLRSDAACRRINRTITALLFLARDQPAGACVCHALELARELPPHYQALLDSQANELVLEVADITLAAPPEAGSTLLHNLVAHAASHTEHSIITLQIDREGIEIRYGDGRLVPSNPDDVFNREYRPEAGGQFGLGLYLVGRICAHLDWPVCARSVGSRRASIYIRYHGEPDAR